MTSPRASAGSATLVEDLADLLLWWVGWISPEDREPVLWDEEAGARGVSRSTPTASPTARRVVPASIDLAEHP